MLPYAKTAEPNSVMGFELKESLSRKKATQADCCFSFRKVFYIRYPQKLHALLASCCKPLTGLQEGLQCAHHEGLCHQLAIQDLCQDLDVPARRQLGTTWCSLEMELNGCSGR